MVSIVVPAYNCSKTISACLESILNQSYKNIEIIVVDDGSTDDTCLIVEQYINKDNRIKLIKKSNSGPSGARNYGIENSSGEYLTFVDSDDIVYENYINNMIECMMNENADLVICNLIRFDETTEKTNNNVESKVEVYKNKNEIINNFLNLMGKGVVNSPVCKMYSLDIIKKNNIMMDESLSIGEDLQFNLCYFEYINKLIILPDILYQYNIYNSSLTVKHRLNLFDERKVSIEMFEKFLLKYKIDTNIVHYLYIKLLFAECIQMNRFRKIYKRNTRLKRISDLCKKDCILLAKKKFHPCGIIQFVLYVAIKINCITIIDILSWGIMKLKGIYTVSNDISV